MFPEEIRKLKRDECLILVNGYNPVKDKKISTLDHPMFSYLQEFSKDYTFDGRVERARKRRVSSNGNTLPESVNMDKVNYLITLDKKVMEEYKKEAHICKITGDTPPDKPKSNVITLTEDQLMSLDFTDTDVSLVDWEKVFISIDPKENINEILEKMPIPKKYFYQLLKMLGITYAADFSSNICKDAGYQAIAVQIELFGKVTILVLSLPILLTLLRTIQEFLS